MDKTEHVIFDGPSLGISKVIILIRGCVLGVRCGCSRDVDAIIASAGGHSWLCMMCMTYYMNSTTSTAMALPVTTDHLTWWVSEWTGMKVGSFKVEIS